MCKILYSHTECNDTHRYQSSDCGCNLDSNPNPQRVKDGKCPACEYPTPSNTNSSGSGTNNSSRSSRSSR